MTLDLSHPLSAATPLYPGDQPTALAQRKFLAADGYNAWSLSTGLHTGTHVDLPLHFLDDSRRAADFPPECFMGPGRLIDARGQWDIGLQPAFEAVQPGEIVLLYTGWDRLYRTEEYFTAHPAVTEELADFLIRRGVRMLGVDMAAPDHSPFPVHRALLARDIPILENLTGLERLLGVPAFQIHALPLRIEAEASPVRAVAVVNHPIGC